jgi:hypothetical protein
MNSSLFCYLCSSSSLQGYCGGCFVAAWIRGRSRGLWVRRFIWYTSGLGRRAHIGRFSFQGSFSDAMLGEKMDLFKALMAAAVPDRAAGDV